LDDHVDFFWRRSKLVGRGHEMFPNVEEITESMGAYRAALRYMEEHAVPCHCGGAVAVVCCRRRLAAHSISIRDVPSASRALG